MKPRSLVAVPLGLINRFASTFLVSLGHTLPLAPDGRSQSPPAMSGITYCDPMGNSKTPEGSLPSALTHKHRLNQRRPNSIPTRVHVQSIGTKNLWFRLALLIQHRAPHVYELRSPLVCEELLDAPVRLDKLRREIPSTGTRFHRNVGDGHSAQLTSNQPKQCLKPRHRILRRQLGIGRKIVLATIDDNLLRLIREDHVGDISGHIQQRRTTKRPVQNWMRREVALGICPTGERRTPDEQDLPHRRGRLSISLLEGGNVLSIGRRSGRLRRALQRHHCDERQERSHCSNLPEIGSAM